MDELEAFVIQLLQNARIGFSFMRRYRLRGCGDEIRSVACIENQLRRSYRSMHSFDIGELRAAMRFVSAACAPNINRPAIRFRGLSLI